MAEVVLDANVIVALLTPTPGGARGAVASGDSSAILSRPELPPLPRDAFRFSIAWLGRLVDGAERGGHQGLNRNVGVEDASEAMGSYLGQLPGLAVPARTWLGSVRQRDRSSQVLTDGNQLWQTSVRRVGHPPRSIEEPRDPDEVPNGLSGKWARHGSREQPSRRRVKPALTLPVPAPR
jgi:hypothetical protein